MVDIKSGDGDRFAARPDSAIRLALFHGPDAGLVAERAGRFIAAVASDAIVVRLDSDEIAADPRLVLDEAYGLSLFAERKAIRVRVQGNRPIVAALEPLVAAPPEDSWVILEAGDLRKGTPLRRLFEDARTAASIVCYPDDARALDRLVSDELKTHRLTASDGARRLLIEHLGADRLASRAELAKLALYVGAGEVSESDVRAVIGDAAELAMGDAVDAAASGDAEGCDRALRRLFAEGTSATAIAGAALRHFQMLHLARAAVDGGASIGAALDRQRAPAFGPRRAALERHLRIWSRPRLEQALDALGEVIGAGRTRPATEAAMIRAALLRVAAAASREGAR